MSSSPSPVPTPLATTPPTPPAEPPDLVKRWGPTLTMLVATLAVFTWLGLSPPWETKARAEERAQAGSAALRQAQSECRQQLSDAVGAQTAQIRALDGRLVRLEAQQQQQMYVLQLLALKLGVPLPQSLTLAPPPASAPAPGGQPLVP